MDAELKKIVLIMEDNQETYSFKKSALSNVVFKINIDSFLFGFLLLENKTKQLLLDCQRIVGTGVFMERELHRNTLLWMEMNQLQALGIFINDYNITQVSNYMFW